MKNENRIVELLAESLQRQDRVADEMHNLRIEINNRFEQMDKRFERIEGILERLAVGFNEFVDIHRVTVRQQNDRLNSIEQRLDNLERRAG